MEKSNRQIASELKLLDLTLKNASAIQCSFMGEFTAVASHEILVARPGGALEVYKIETSEEEQKEENEEEEEEEEERRIWLKMLMRVETRSIIRSIEIVRLGGEKRDLVIVGSDSGNVSVLDLQGAQANILHCPAFGKTGKCYFFIYEILFFFWSLLLLYFCFLLWPFDTGNNIHCIDMHSVSFSTLLVRVHYQDVEGGLQDSILPKTPEVEPL